MRKIDIFACVLAGLVVLLICCLRPDPYMLAGFLGSGLLCLRYKQTGNRTLLLIAMLSPLVGFFSGVTDGLIVYITPHPIDALLLRTDFGVSHWIAIWAVRHPYAFVPFSAAYLACSLGPAIVIAYSQRPGRLMATFVLGAVLVVPFYIAFPAVGPRHVGEVHAWRNCMPSLHLASALMVCWFTPRRFKLLGIAFAVLTAGATLMTGEHYVIDLVAAFPFAAMIIWLGDRLPEMSHIPGITRDAQDFRLRPSAAVEPVPELNPEA